MKPDTEKKYGLSWYELENTIWLNHWDTFRSIGAKCNIITFDSPFIKSLGLSDNTAHFYKNTPENLPQMADEILKIVKNKDKLKNYIVNNCGQLILPKLSSGEQFYSSGYVSRISGTDTTDLPILYTYS